MTQHSRVVVLVLVTLCVSMLDFGLPPRAAAQTRHAAISPIRCEQPLSESMRQDIENSMSKLLQTRGFRVIPSAHVRLKDTYAPSECEQGSCLSKRLSALGAELLVISTLWLSSNAGANPEPHTLSLTVYAHNGHQAIGKAQIHKGELPSASTHALKQALDALSTDNPLRVRIDGTPVGASVSIDGTVMGDLPWEGQLAPGTHRLKVAMQGFAPQERAFTLNGSTPPSAITVRLGSLDPDAAGSDAAEATSSKVRTEPSPLNYWLAGGLGAAGLALAAYGGVHALQDGDCTGDTDPGGYCGQRVSFGGAQIASLIVGGVLVAAGVVVLVWKPLSVDVQVGKEHAAFSVGGEF